MSYEIVWWQQAPDQMARYLAEHPNRIGELAVAMRQVAVELADDPDTAGESRAGDYRVTVVAPLTVYFRLASGERTVYLVEIHLPD